MGHSDAEPEVCDLSSGDEWGDGVSCFKRGVGGKYCKVIRENCIWAPVRVFPISPLMEGNISSNFSQLMCVPSIATDPPE